MALLQALDEYGIVDTATLHGVLEVAAADFARTLCDALRAAPPAAEIGTMTDTAVLKHTAVQTALAGDVVGRPDGRGARSQGRSIHELE